eukprot:230909_1
MAGTWMYLPASTPHLIALSCVQFPFVLSESQIRNGDYSLYPVTLHNFEKHFTFSVRNWNERRYHTLLTYSLVHYNLNHFYNNFLSIAFVGSHIIRSAGGAIFWITALNGSIFGGLASLIEYKYHHRHSRLQKTKQDAKTIWNTLTEPVHDMVQHYGNKLIDKSFEIVNESQGMVGCSASVYALYAFDFALTIDRSKKRFAKYWQKYVLGDYTVDITQNETLCTLYDMVSLYTGVKRIQSDLEYLWHDKVNRSKIDHLIVASPDNIAHGSHIGGFIAGLITFGLWKLYTKRAYNNNNIATIHTRGFIDSRSSGVESLRSVQNEYNSNTQYVWKFYWG